MDPWLERPTLFPSLHGCLIGNIRAMLNAALPTGYVATQDARVVIDPELVRIPDVGVYGPDGPALDAAGGGTVATLERAGLLAVAADPVSDPVEEVYLEIRSADDDERLVTAVEVVSPANKQPGRGREAYLQKQGEYRVSAVNVVELDLLRSGPHTTAVAAARLRAVAGEYDYHVCVWLAEAVRYFVAPILLADRLPTIPIPLDPGVPPVPVDLQAAFERAYDEGGFAKLAKYGRRDPDPPLSADQRAWADGLLRVIGGPT
jgi:hypothetical protein